jgi:DNA repair protein RadC
MKNSFTVHDLPVTERPRERLIKFGVESLSIPELLALILGRGTKGKSVLVTASELLQRYKSLKKLAGASINELCTIQGIGEAKATQIKAALELAKRMEDDDSVKITKTAVKCPEDILHIIKKDLKGKKKEHFILALLDTRNHLIAIRTISIGSLDTSIVHPREVFLEAVSNSAASVIFIHNHPSGNPEPSEEDIKLTRQLIEAGKLLDIDVLDHIIIGDDGYLSMKAKNLI